MSINEWWAGDGSERYWMEITNRSDIGTNLHAPKVDDGGREYWSYALVNHTRPGDIVFHWDKNAGPGITSFSVVTEMPRSSTILWQSRGTYGRAHPASSSEPAWLTPLGGLVDLADPLTQERLRALEPEVEKIRDHLETTHGSPIYFPYALSKKRPLRAAQGYLVKFPRALVEAFSELRLALDLSQESPDSRRPELAPPVVVKKKDQKVASRGRMRDAKRKKAIEMHAVTVVMKRWRKDGYKVQDVGLTNSWDVTATRGIEEVHIEVKGSSGTRDAVDLTDGEVRHAEASAETVLVVVDQIKVDADNKCEGGRTRIWRNWVPERRALVPTAYRYSLPIAHE